MKNRIPSYRHHKQSGQAVVTLPDGRGGRRDVLLGAFGSSASKAEYRRLVAEWLANGHTLPATPASCGEATIGELIAQYWDHVEDYYRRIDGKQTSEVHCILHSLRPLAYLYGDMQLKEFGATQLNTARQLMIDGYVHKKYGEQPRISRASINSRVKRIRRMFKWGVSKDLVAPDTLTRLQSLDPLKRGRTKADESKGVKAIARAVVEDTLPILSPMVADMVTIQLETGMRPGELVSMRTCDIDMSGALWIYRPTIHKTLHHGIERNIVIGPKAKAILQRHLGLATESLLFSPATMMEERREARRRVRKTRVQPSQLDRRKKNAKRRPTDGWTVESYGRSIRNAITQHNKDKPDGEHIPQWRPNQLRHLRALELKREFGLDVARAVLGHQQPAMTEHYAGLDIQAAIGAMGKVG